jgi:hypothetical protein
MNAVELSAGRLGSRSIQRGRVAATNGDGTITIAGADGSLLPCEILVTASADSTDFVAGDEVLVWRASEEAECNVVLGKIRRAPIGPMTSSSSQTMDYPMADERVEAPDELVFEAKHSLTLRVGDGSITIREDGKILIKGKDLVSHAQRMNRIKGGAVSIN